VKQKLSTLVSQKIMSVFRVLLVRQSYGVCLIVAASFVRAAVQRNFRIRKHFALTRTHVVITHNARFYMREAMPKSKNRCLNKSVQLFDFFA